ncbi:MAG: hypothetical protein JXA21_24100 [Anaerolineae bacterium]|nr:hypothetical protein [Anaerolineae bacterium]
MSQETDTIPTLKIAPAQQVQTPRPGCYYEWPDGTLTLCVSVTVYGAQFAGEIGTPMFFKQPEEMPLLTEMQVVGGTHASLQR